MGLSTIIGRYISMYRASLCVGIVMEGEWCYDSYFGNPLVTIHGHIICYLTRLHSYHNVIWHLPHPSRFSGSYDHLTSMLAPPLPTLAVLLCHRVSINCFKAQSS